MFSTGSLNKSLSQTIKLHFILGLEFCQLSVAKDKVQCLHTDVILLWYVGYALLCLHLGYDGHVVLQGCYCYISLVC